MKAIIQLKCTRHRSSGEIIGFRMQAAIPNEAGRVMRACTDGQGEVLSFYATSQLAPSFNRPYLIEETSDYSLIGKGEMKRFLEKLRWQGYTAYEFVGKMWERVRLDPHSLV
ncbi:hypothetical protein [Cupriavidus taiwanensis]|nr:hypothetical protein [Cupriavidus taiwanensis]